MDFLRVTDLNPDDLRQVLATAARIKQDPAAVAGSLRDRNVGLFFEKPSARTRVSTEVACNQLGAHPVVLRGEEIGLGRREAVEDVARVFDRYLDVLALRVYDHQHLETIAEYAAAPVINLLSDAAHPCQALADLQTIAEHRDLEQSTIAYVGDGNNVCHSLLAAASLAGTAMRIATPPGFAPDPQAVTAAEERGGSVSIGFDPWQAVAGADVVYTDVWTSMGQEDEAADRLATFSGFEVTADMFAAAAPDAVFLHCLPAHRGEEVAAAVLEGPRSVVFDQAENRLHSFKALLLHLLT